MDTVTRIAPATNDYTPLPTTRHLKLKLLHLPCLPRTIEMPGRSRSRQKRRPNQFCSFAHRHQKINRTKVSTVSFDYKVNSTIFILIRFRNLCEVAWLNEPGNEQFKSLEIKMQDKTFTASHHWKNADKKACNLILMIGYMRSLREPTKVWKERSYKARAILPVSSNPIHYCLRVIT